MSRSDPTGGLLLGTGAGFWLFFKGFRVFREFKIVADTPRMPIRSLAMGPVQVRGTGDGSADSQPNHPYALLLLPGQDRALQERHPWGRVRDALPHRHGRRQILPAGSDRQSADGPVPATP